MSFDHTFLGSNNRVASAENYLHSPANEWDLGASPGVEVTDAAPVNWESAWIDLGGEG